MGSALPLNAANYYVDFSAGSDANTGTSTSAAWKHCPGDASATLIAGATSLIAGDTVTFKGGVSYEITSAPGIALRWSGTAGSPITYDGNSAGNWGSGRARFTSNYAADVTAFSATTAVSNLNFKNLEISALGGAATLPADGGSAVAPRFGGGFSFANGLSNATIDGCVFSNLGYAFNQKPMGASSLNGAAIKLPSANTVTISNCDFSRVTTAIDLSGNGSVSGVSVTNATFHDFVVWTFDLPAAKSSGVTVSGSTESNNAQFDAASWTGYGTSPRVVTKTANAGETVTLTASSLAIPTATYQWQKNGQPISGANASTLTFAPVATTDAGTYSVIATNSAGSTPSNSYVLNVNGTSPTTPVVGAPVITTQPVSQTVAPLSPVTFTVSATGYPAPTFQWSRNGTAISGATGTSLTIPSVSSTDVGTYVVVATNSGGSVTSNSATLTIIADGTSSAPVISTQPVSQTVAPGTTIILSVTVSGSPAPTVQWFRDGITYGSWSGSSLILYEVTTADAGNYVAVATNAAGSVTSNPAALTVGTVTPPPPAATAPVITTQPQSQTVAAAGNVTFTVAASGSPTPTLQWFRNGASLSGATGTTLALTNVSSTDAGTYHVVATNSAGSATSATATLTVNAPSGSAPVITTQPVSQTVAPGTTIVLSVNVSGSPAPTVQWFRDGITYGSWSGSSLILYEVTTADAGNYVAVATNSAGSVTSNPATLTIGTVTPPPPAATAPAITTQPQSQTIVSGANVTFTVAASGSPTPTLQWLYNGAPLSGATNSTLTLTNVSSSNAGTYAAVATNSAGSATSNSATLTVTAPAPVGTAPVITTQPIGLTVERRATATFSVTATGTPAPTYKWFRDGITFPGWTSSTLTLPDVTGNDVGTYTVVVSNSAGSVTSNPVKLSIASKSKVSSATTAATDGATTGDAAPASRLVNLSVRSTAGAGDDSLIVGFVVSGGTSKSLLMRGSGPALSAFGVTGVLADPTLALYSGSALLAANDDWSSGNADQIAPAAANAGAFAFANASRDAALLANVEAGAYTGQVSSKDAQPGTALIELYDTTPDVAARLVNVSVRTAIAPSGDAPVIGFVVAGTQPKKLLVRAVGPSLADFGVTGAVSDPKLELFAGAQRIDGNDDWSGDTALVDTFNRVGAFPLTGNASKDAALIVTAAPGDYTVVVSGANRTHGTVLVEVYELP